MEELNMSEQIDIKETKQRYYRATFVHAACVDMQITVEFEAPFPRDESIEYSQLALRSFLEQVSAGHIKIRDIEPVET